MKVLVFFITLCIAGNCFAQHLLSGQKYKIPSHFIGEKKQFEWFMLHRIDSAFMDHWDYYFVNGKDTFKYAMYVIDTSSTSFYSVAEYQAIERKFGPVVTKRIVLGDAWIGMSKAQARASWGEPDDINTTTSRYSVSEQWVYDNRRYLYFENGKLTTIQN